MTAGGTLTAAGGARGGTRRSARTALLVAAAVVVPAAVTAVLAAGAWAPMLLLAVVAVLAFWTLADARATIVVTVLLATFVDYTTGRIAMEMAIVCAWLAWTALVLFWRGAWSGAVLPRREMAAGLVVWLSACTMGVIVGVLRGHRFQDLGIELAGALWPALGLGIIQVFERRSLLYAGVALGGIALVHTVFGLTMLQIHQRRLGGIYFTTVTGIAALLLWTAALLAPSRKVRAWCLAGMIPLLVHLLFSFTRGYWLGFIVGFAVVTLLGWRNLSRFEPAERWRRLRVLPALAAVIVAALGFSMLFFGGSDLLEAVGGRFSSSFSTEVSGATLSNLVRLDEYDRAIAAALESPIIGRGLGFSFITKDLLLGTIRDQWFVHNYYLLIWLKLGLVGLAAFAFLLWTSVRAARRVADSDPDWRARAWSIGAIAVTVQVLTILATNYSLADLTTAFVFAFVWGVFWSIRQAEAGAAAPAAPAAAAAPAPPAAPAAAGSPA